MENELREVRRLLIYIGVVLCIIAIAIIRSAYADDPMQQVWMLVMVTVLFVIFGVELGRTLAGAVAFSARAIEKTEAATIVSPADVSDGDAKMQTDDRGYIETVGIDGSRILTAMCPACHEALNDDWMCLNGHPVSLADLPQAVQDYITGGASP